MVAQKFDYTDVVASVCRDSYYEFVKRHWHLVIAEEPIWNWHIRLICDTFQEAMERVFKKLPKEGDYVINISPGTTKSTVLSVLSQPWVWTRMPSAKGIFGSYSYDIALDLSRKSRDCVMSEYYQKHFPYVQLRDDQNTKGYFATTRGGYRYCIGVRGSVTGMHGHFIVVDDPLDPNQSVSKPDLEAANRWLKETLSSRKVDKRVSPTFLVMQRLTEGDPSDLFKKRPRCKHLSLPAEIEGEDTQPIPRHLETFYKDGMMDPVRLPREVLREAESDMGRAAYAAQFLQAPSPPEGDMFNVKKLKIIRDLPDKFAMIVRFWDKASTEDGGTFTCGVKMAKDKEGRFYILDVRKFRHDSGRRERMIKKVADYDGYSTVVGVEQEGGGGGKESAESTVRNLAGYRVRVVKVGKASGDKVSRADPYSVQVNHGNVYLVEGDWNEDYIDELKHFPKGRFKDQVDASSGAFNLLYRRRRRCGAINLESASTKASVRVVTGNITPSRGFKGTGNYRKSRIYTLLA